MPCFVDPQGATFGVHASATAPQPETAPKAGEVFVATSSRRRQLLNVAFGFYAALFDWDLVAEHDMGPMGSVSGLRPQRPAARRHVRQKAPRASPAARTGSATSASRISRALVERAKSARGSVLMGPMDVPGGDRVAQLMDPYGAFFALHKAGAQARPPRPEARGARACEATAAAKKPAARKAAKKAPRANALHRRRARKRSARRQEKGLRASRPRPSRRRRLPRKSEEARPLARGGHRPGLRTRLVEDLRRERDHARDVAQVRRNHERVGRAREVAELLSRSPPRRAAASPRVRRRGDAPRRRAAGPRPSRSPPRESLRPRPAPR